MDKEVSKRIKIAKIPRAFMERVSLERALLWFYEFSKKRWGASLHFRLREGF